MSNSWFAQEHDWLTDELTGYEEHLDHEQGAYGDPRRCPHHPHVQTSSPDGLFDAPCGYCENQDDTAYYEAHPEESLALSTFETIPSPPPVHNFDDIPF